MPYHWDFMAVLQDYRLFIEGAKGTLILTTLSLLLAIPLGALLCALRVLRIPLLGAWSAAYVDILRAVPAIVLFYWLFFAFPMITGLGLSALVVSVGAVALQSAAFFSEVFRSGLNAIPRGQWEAALSLGMSRHTAFLFVIAPQSLRALLPSFMTRAIDLIKTTTFASVISYNEIVYAASQVTASTYHPIETYVVLGGIFFVPIFVLSMFARSMERRLGRGRSQ
ncbi:amino acid ABC transporter permease [Acetobacter malorum DSM 14337]|uniref:Amino acid ABC transporter permease n=1 Tax=Acetobacter malorum DSM 14337 TaxID=1307910 RepID=A0ABQ0PT00_9PROT|nr:amino acid ABC transporter permease [Acetobacter malorum]KXV04956.1 hypothetical protein AD930_15405 [Acetobacter malorum]GBQ80273.1 amino acid ABC transporter permease [Acetobacter malorum DSM 14337]